MRNLILPVLALVLGMAVGFTAMHALRANELAEAQRANTRVAAEREELETALHSVRDTLEAVERENDKLRAEKSALLDQLAALQKLRAEEEATQTEAPPPPSIPMESLLGGLFRGGPGDMTAEQDGVSPETEEEDNDEQARWNDEERSARFRQMVRGYLDNRLANAQTVAEQERIVTLMEYTDYLASLRDNMRSAETEAEREEARAAFYDGIQGVRQIMEEQRNASLTDIASRFGIENPDQQQAFVRQMEHVMRDPLLGGFMGGPGMRGPGGRGGRDRSDRSDSER